MFSDQKRLTIHQLDALIYQGRQEGEAHKALAETIATMARSDLRIDPHSIKIGEYLPPTTSERGRFPDVQFTARAERFAVEVQLSAITLHRLVERSEHYRREGVRLIWVMKGFDPETYARTWLWDVVANQGHIAYGIDDESLQQAAVDGRFLLVERRQTSAGIWASQLVSLDELARIEPLWHDVFKRDWVEVAGTNWQEATKLVMPLFDRLGIVEGEGLDRWEAAHAVNCLVSIERWEAVGSAASNPLQVVHGLLNSHAGALVFPLVQAALKEFRPDCLERPTTKKLLEGAKQRAKEKGIRPWDRTHPMGQIRSALFPLWRLPRNPAAKGALGDK